MNELLELFAKWNTAQGSGFNYLKIYDDGSGFIYRDTEEKEVNNIADFSDLDELSAFLEEGLRNSQKTKIEKIAQKILDLCAEDTIVNELTRKERVRQYTEELNALL